MSTERRVAVSRQLKAAISGSGLQLSELCEQAGVQLASVWRFMEKDGNLRSDTIDKLARVLKLRLVQDKEPRK